MRKADASPRIAATARRGTASAALLTELASEHGMSPERCVRGTRLVPSDLQDVHAEIDAAQELAVITNIVTELGHVPGLGLEAGRRYHATTYGLLGLAVLSSATVGQALEVGLRYKGLSFAFAPFVVSLTEAGWRVVLDDRALRAEFGDEVTRFIAERETAAAATFIRDLVTEDQVLQAVVFRHAEPSYAELYYEVLGVRPTFGKPESFGVISADTLTAPLIHADARTAMLSRHYCERQLQERLGPATIVADKIRQMLLHRLGRGEGIVSQRQIATDLGFSERTLRRQLADEGTRYADVAAETMIALATDLLEAGHTVESVASVLGYSGTSSFGYAFKRWTGTTPGSHSRAARP